MAITFTASANNAALFNCNEFPALALSRTAGKRWVLLVNGEQHGKAHGKRAEAEAAAEAVYQAEAEREEGNNAEATEAEEAPTEAPAEPENVSLREAPLPFIFPPLNYTALCAERGSVLYSTSSYSNGNLNSRAGEYAARVPYPTEPTGEAACYWLATVAALAISEGAWVPRAQLVALAGRYTTGGFQQANPEVKGFKPYEVHGFMKAAIAEKVSEPQHVSHEGIEAAALAALLGGVAAPGTGRTVKVKPTASNTATATVQAPTAQQATTGAAVQVTTSAGKKGGKRFSVNLCGEEFPVTSVLRWFGANANTFAEAQTALAALGMAEVQPTTIRAQLYSGRKGNAGPHGKVPVLRPEQEAILKALVGE